MAFTLQNVNGTITNANAYTDAATVKTYWADRGIDLSATHSDAEVEVAIVKATSYLDARYIWTGYQLHRLQGTQWPRGGVTLFLQGIPPALVTATCMLAQRVLAGIDLLPDPTFDTSGQVVSEVTKKIGPIENTIKYAESSSASLAATSPKFPEVTMTLRAAGLINSSNSGQLRRS